MNKNMKDFLWGLLIVISVFILLPIVGALLIKYFTWIGHVFNVSFFLK